MEIYRSKNDLQLVGLLQDGDRKAFAELFGRYNGLLYAHAYKMIGEKEEARDVVQEIFTSLWDQRENLSVKSNFAGFLYASIRNRIFNLMLHHKVQEKYLQSIGDFVESSEAETDYMVRTKELQAIIEAEVAKLPAKMREVFELSRKHHLSHKEIANELGLSEKTVKNQVNNALKILRGKLGLMAYLYLLFGQ